LELNGVVRVIVGGFSLAAANYIMATKLVATTQRNYMNYKTKPYGITKHRHEGYMYFATSHAEHQQYLEMVLGDIKPEQAKWTIPPLKYNPNGYQPTIITSGGLTHIVTSPEEMEYAIGGAWGGKDDPNFEFKVAPMRYAPS
jgi:hypothetical protein